MNRKWLKRWLGACVLGPVVAGCTTHHSCPTCPHYPSPVQPVQPVPAAPPPSAYVYTDRPLGELQAGTPITTAFMSSVIAPPSRVLAVESQLAQVAQARQPVRITIETIETEQDHDRTQGIALARAPEAPTPPPPMPALEMPGQIQLPVEPPRNPVAVSPPPAPLPVQPVRPVEPPAPVAPAPAPKMPPSAVAAPPPSPVMPVPRRDEAVRQVEAKGSVVPSAPPAVEPPVEHKAVTPAIMNGYGHAEDYTWLTGQLQHSRGKGWRLRYADIDEVDTHGGSVTLVEDARLEKLEDGQFVHVKGFLVNPDGKAIAPPYRLESIQAADKQE